MEALETTAFFDKDGTIILNNLPVVKNRKARIIILLEEEVDMTDSLKAFSAGYDLAEPDHYTQIAEEPVIEYNRIKEGDIALVELPQSGGAFKLRPAVILKQLPKFNDFLVCGISGQQQHYVEDFDEMIDENHELFPVTGLHKDSVIRLSSLAVFNVDKIMRHIGKIPAEMHKLLLKRLGEFILK